MSRISFGNPVAGLIRPPGSPFIDRSFRVTAYVPDPYLRFEGNPEVTVEVRMGRR